MLGIYVKNYDPVACNNAAKELHPKVLMLNLHKMDFLRHLLLSTGECEIFEATRDRVLGTGLTLYHPDCLNHTAWYTSRSTMSEIICYYMKN